ncbi:hypothetical protein GXB78_04655 [Pseudomonas moraviensis subsp. stanleyae]|uniref:Ig-like domain-containing protein n=1 Tax=Pseudomonas moraviensis TaxID=321662 RepID=UPI002E31FC8A|nr:Ig-like domain-containing protein [Pseudomonas moraviensis]MED7666504.1 hypothetical protein [Pseudomonas moraviensis subsp. stanleyae]
MSRIRNFVEPFALSLPSLREMIKLDPAMPDVHGGVSIADANQDGGLRVLMLAYLGQAVDDTLTVYVNGIKGPNTTIVEGKENVDTPVQLPGGSLQKGLNRIKIHTERPSGNIQFTPELVLYHRTSPPGDSPPVMKLTVSHKVINQAEADKFKVTVTYANLQWYDRIVVSCNGVHHIYQLTPSSVSPLPPVPESVVIDIPKDKLIDGGNDKTFEIKYRVVDYLTNESGPPTWSDAVFVEVDLDKIPLDPPTLVNAVSPIDVLASEGGVRVRAEFKAALENDKATLKIVDGVPGSSFPQVAFNTNQRANFTFSVAFLLAHQGKAIQVSWVLIRNGVPSGESPPLEVVIDKIAVDDPRLPTPNIAGEMGQQLNVPELPNDARVLSEKVPLMQQTHPVWVDFEGVDADGNPVTNEISSGGRSELADRISLLAQVEWLKKLKDASPLRVVCAINLDGIRNKTDAVPLRVRTYTVSVAPALEIDTTPMLLDGVKLTQEYGWATKEVIDNVKLREASGGVPPYIYSSSDDSTASVAENGNVTGLKNGFATISVKDSTGTALNYSVQVSNVYKVKADNRLMAVPEAVSWIRSQGGESYDNFFIPPTVKAIPFNFVDLQTVLLPIPDSIPNGFFRWFGRGQDTSGAYAVFNSASGAFYQGMGRSYVRMAPIAFIKT